ncbi:DUF3325 domain-containing protein [Sphingobium sp.]|uniref:DUF3325 domain-containing protein n=1 Tax=Sphingobium sp. TaxID=1912891 RepID=UPI003B3AC4B1
MMILLSFILALTGLAAMGLSQAQHHQWALGRKLDDGRAFLIRWVGFSCIAFSLIPAIAAWGPAFGLVGWFGIISAAAFALLLLRTYLPPPTRP